MMVRVRDQGTCSVGPCHKDGRGRMTNLYARKAMTKAARMSDTSATCKQRSPYFFTRIYFITPAQL